MSAYTIPGMAKISLFVANSYIFNGDLCSNYVIFFIIIISGVGLMSPGTAATSGLLYSPKW
jgi:hypothetical protein